MDEKVDSCYRGDTEREVDPKDSGKQSKLEINRWSKGPITYSLQLAMPPIAAPMIIPLTNPRADASAMIPIYFPRSRRDTMSVTRMEPTTKIPPAPRP